jgi:YVTN family beta-propeller protein
MSEIVWLARPGLALASVAAVLVVSAGAAAGAGHATPVSGEPSLAGRAPTAYISIAGNIHVTGHTVTPINTGTNTAGTPIRLGQPPGSIAVTPDGRTVYVVSDGSSEFTDGTVTPIATASNTAGKPIRAGIFPDEIAISPDGKTAYVTNLESDTVTPISTATNTAGEAIPVGVRPQALAVTPNGKTLYVVNQGDSATGPSSVTPIATATGKPGKPIRVGNSPLTIAITPNGRTAYVANSGLIFPSRTVTPIDTATNRPGPPIKVGTFPFAIAITPDGKTVYVANAGSDTVTPIATASNTPGSPIKVGRAPQAIAITPDGQTAYVVSGSDSVTPINVATNTPGAPIKVTGYPGEIAITPDGKTVYVSDGQSDTVTPIATATNKAGKPIVVGEGPYEIAIAAGAGGAGPAAPSASALAARELPAWAAPMQATSARADVVRGAAKLGTVGQRPVGTAPAEPPGSAVRDSVVHEVLVLNGDRLLVRQTGAGPQVLGIVPGAGSRAARTVLALDLGGVSYEIPQVALPYLGRGLNPDLFALRSLAAREIGGRLPLTIGYRGGLPALPGVTITHAGSGTADGYLTAAGARTFGVALGRQFAADHARGSYGQDGMFVGGVSVGLAGAPARAAVPSRSPGFVMRTLTIRGINLAGRPDTGDSVLVMNADNSRLFADPIESENVFDHGIAKFSVPAGHYWAIGLFSNLYPGLHEAVLPQVNVLRNTAVTMDARKAKDRLRMVTPRPAVQHFAALTLRHSTPAGPAEAVEIATEQNPIPIFVTPTTRRPTAGTLQVFPVEQLAPQFPGTPYIYVLAFRNTSGLIPQLRYVVRTAQLAAVHARYYARPHGFGDYYQDAFFPRQNTDVAPGFLGETGLQFSLPAPREITEYLTAGPGVLWTGFYFLPGSGLGGQFDGWRAFRQGGRVTQNWNAYPLHEGYNVDLTGAANPSPWVPSASRAGDTLTLDVTPYSDNTPGHLAPGDTAASTGHYSISEGGKTLAAGQPRSRIGFNGEFDTHVTLSPRPGTVTFALSVALPGRFGRRLSPASQTVWTWRSAREPGAMLPPGWTCEPNFRKPVRACAAEPMMTLNYGMAGLALDGLTPPGHQTLHLTAGHLQLAKAAAVTGASVLVSFDGGKVWHPAQLSGRAGQYSAVFTAPAGATVTLRAHAADAAGGTITETIPSAYRVAS